MDIGIGLPNTIPATPGPLIADWARTAERCGFARLGTIGRVAYPNYEELTCLAAAAAVTERIELMTDILLAPTRDPVLLAKQAASVDAMSGGRLTLGLGVGEREDDFVVTGSGYRDRGRRTDALLALLHAAWEGEPVAGSPVSVTPAPARDGRIPVLVGGLSDAAIHRAAAHDGWTIGGMGPTDVKPHLDRLREAWSEAGREGQPRSAALLYFSLGEGTEDDSIAYLEDYYGFAPYAAQLARSIPRSAGALQEIVHGFEEIGLDHLLFFPTLASVDQVELLADVVGEHLRPGA